MNATITVLYEYLKKSDHKWYFAEADFDDLEAGIRFIYAIKRSKNKVLDGYSCLDPEDEEYVQYRVGY